MEWMFNNYLHNSYNNNSSLYWMQLLSASGDPSRSCVLSTYWPQGDVLVSTESAILPDGTWKQMFNEMCLATRAVPILNKFYTYTSIITIAFLLQCELRLKLLLNNIISLHVTSLLFMASFAQ